MKEREQRRVPLILAPQAVVKREHVERVALLRVAPVVRTPDVDPRELALVVVVVVKQRRNEIVRRRLGLTVKEEREEAEVEVGRRAGVAARALRPGTEGRTDEVEAALLAGIQVREQRWDDRVAARRAGCR